MTIGLVMIVRNEAPILPRLAESVRDHIDYWTVCDTGSTDLTMDTAYAVLAPVPGQVIQHPFDGFASSRNVALKAAEPHSDWLLTIDADETFHGSITLGEADCIEAEQHNGDLRFWLPRLVRSGTGWRWHGRVHEYLASPTARPPSLTKSFYVQHHGDGHDRPEKFDRDMGLLMQDWEEQPNARTAFYIARTYQDHGDAVHAERWWRERLALPGWDEEAFYARYCLGLVLFDLGKPEQACGNLWLAWGMKPHRAEPLVALAGYYRQVEQWRLAWQATELAFTHCLAQPNNKQPYYMGLFLDSSAAGWRVAYEASISAFYVNQRQRGKKLEEWLLHQDLPEPFMASVLANRSFYD